MKTPLVVGVGGTTRLRSTTAAALLTAIEAARGAGARTEVFAADFIESFPLYSPGVAARTPEVSEFIAAIRRAGGVIVASPGYHGGVSGGVKNALDYLEDLRDDARPYLYGRAVGCIATGAGWQAAVTTMSELQKVVHALRGWPTPLGAALNTTASSLHTPVERERERLQLEIIGREVVEFAKMRQAWIARAELSERGSFSSVS